MPKSRKVVTMLISLLAAVLLWLYVVTAIAPEVTTNVSNIPINIDGTVILDNRNLMIVDQDVTSVALDISTSRANVSKLNANSIRVNANAGSLDHPGQFPLSCTVIYPDTVRDSEVSTVRISPAVVNVTVAEKKEISLPVKLNWTGSMKEGFLFDTENVEIEPRSVTVSGPAEEIAKIAECEVDYDVTSLEDSVVETVPLSFRDAEGEILELSELITVSDTQASVTLPVLRTKTLSLKLELREGGGVTAENAEITLTPETITVKGAAEVINALPDELVVGELDLATVEERETRSYNLTLPSNVTNSSGETSVSADIRIKGVRTDAISVSNIQLVNVAAGYQVEASTRTARVTVRGSIEEIRKLKQKTDSGVYIVVDFSNYDYERIGAFTVAGRVVNESYPSVSMPETVEIDVVVSRLDSSSPENGGDGE